MPINNSFSLWIIHRTIFLFFSAAKRSTANKPVTREVIGGRPLTIAMEPAFLFTGWIFLMRIILFSLILSWPHSCFRRSALILLHICFHRKLLSFFYSTNWAIVVVNALLLNSSNGNFASFSEITSTPQGPVYPIFFTQRIKPLMSYSPSPHNFLLEGS
jgi:hypothetical protein